MSREYDVIVPVNLNNKRLDMVSSLLMKELDPDNEALYTRSFMQKIIDDEGVSVNRKIAEKSLLIKENDVIHIILPDPVDPAAQPENIELDILYEDKDVIVVNKPKGMVVHPAAGNPSGTLVNALLWHCSGNLSGINGVNRPGIVHRIDKDTSGLLLIAKTPEAKAHLARQFFDHTTERTYNALVWGTFKEQSGTIEGALARDNRDRTIYRVWDLEECPQAKEAVTHWRVLEQFPYVTLVECRLETGRTHQIRVHMKHIGHPLFCDEKYGGCEILKGLRTQKYRQYIENCFALCPRQVLHARTLGFTHPRTGERMFFDSQWPEDMTKLINKWRNYEPNNVV